MITIKSPFIGSVKNLTLGDLESVIAMSADSFFYLTFTNETMASRDSQYLGAVQVESMGDNGFKVFCLDVAHFDGDEEDAYISHHFDELFEVFNYIDSLGLGFEEIVWG